MMSNKEKTYRWRRRHPETWRRTWKRSQEKRRPQLFAKRLLKYGLSLEDYTRLLVVQRGICPICERPLNLRGGKGAGDRLVIDHHHTTGQVRGLLCARCNLVVGQFETAQAKKILVYLGFIGRNDQAAFEDS
jgi:hypothetical protein